MINREITYERDVNTSYMKIPSMPEENFDETRILRMKIQGLLSVEKCYVAGAGQYWYNITGRQALDAYCRVNQIGTSFFENLILRFCEQVERLEWNLIDVNCLVADPELIFINHSGEDISFVVYPFHTGDLATELQQLMEYLLTKLDHKDHTAVSSAYQLYEMTLSDGFSVSDLKRHILNTRMENVVVEPQVIMKMISEEKPSETAPERKNSEQDYVSKALQFLDDKLELFYEKVGKILDKTPMQLYRERKVETPVVVYPDEPAEEIVEPEIHPTVCIRTANMGPRGELISTPKGLFPDFKLEKGASIIGKNPKVQLHINKDTISQFHARIEYQEDGYYIEDLKSTNGTYLNEEALNYKKKQRLEAGDMLRFADVTYHFY